MCTEANQFTQVNEQIMGQSQKQSKFFFSEFENKFETIKAFVEDLRQLQIQITAKEDSDISSYTQTIINYLQHPEALVNEKLYRNSLISLGNFLSIKYTFFKKEYLSEKFLKNLVEYFSILCEKQTNQDFNMLAYPVLYLIVLIIYNSDKQTANVLHSKLFVKKFLRALSSVQFEEGNKVERYLPVIIAFIAKGSHSCQNSTHLKKLVLNNIQFSEIEKNQFHFIYTLRILINKESFTLGQVRRYDLLGYLVKFLSKNSNSEQHVSMILEVMKHILKRHQILAYKVASPDFLNIIERAYKVNPDTTLSLLEIICPCLAYTYKQRMLEVHTALLKKYQNENIESIELKELQSLKIISIIIEEINYNDFLIFLQNYSIENLLERTFRGEKRLSQNQEQQVINLVVKVIKSLSVGNKNIMNSFVSMIYKYKNENRRIQVLMGNYFMDLQIPICLE